MRTAILPAQITTVEDRIAANLSLKQLILIITPLIISGLIYFALPPFSHLAIYKDIFTVLVTIFFVLLAYRVNDKIILEWLQTKIHYWLRPRIYVFQKGDSGALQNSVNEVLVNKQSKSKSRVSSEHVELDPLKILKAKRVLDKENIILRFKPNKNGGLNVTAYQAQQVR